MYKPFDLTNMNVLITGGNGGIGLGMAQAVAEAGARVMVWGTNEAKNAQALKVLGANAQAMQVDVADETKVDAGFAQTLEAMGGTIHTVFANAGVGGSNAGGGGPEPFVRMSTEEYKRVQAVNLDGVFFTLRAAARHMEERAKRGQPGGSMVTVASLAAIEGAARSQHYAATKGAVLALTRSCAVELARYGVRANAILPGWIATDMTKSAQESSAFAERVLPRVPARRWGEPADFGGVAVYLASDASAYHSGDYLIVDGGYAIF